MEKEQISCRATIASGVEFGFNVTIGPDVVIGQGTRIHSNVVIEGRTKIGSNCEIFAGAIIGSAPQDLKYRGEPTSVSIGDNTKIREYVTVNRGTCHKDEKTGEIVTGETSVGRNCLIMAYAHVAHDCSLGDGVIMANAATLGGHVVIGEKAFVGGMTPVHQFVRIGQFAMLAGGIRVSQDVPPFCMAAGCPTGLFGLNTVGLERNNFQKDTIEELKSVYRTLFRSKMPLARALEALDASSLKSAEAAQLVEFVRASKRGICR